MKICPWLLAGCLVASLPAYAASPLQVVELSDHELSQLRGRFVLPGRIVHFGVTMSSQWQNAGGQVLGGSVSLQLSDGMYQPQFNVTLISSHDELGAPPAGTGQVIGGAGLGSVGGVTQSVRAAGDFNSAYNDMRISVSHASSVPASGAGGQPLAGIIEDSSSAGSVRVSPGNGGLQIAIQAAGQGSSLQQLGSGGLRQQVSIGGSGNAVSNLTTLEVVLRDSATGQAALQSNWQLVRDLRPAGY